MVYILNQFKEKFTETVDEIKDKERKWFDNMMDNFANNCPYHLLTQKGKTYDEMQAEFATNCPYHLIL